MRRTVVQYTKSSRAKKRPRPGFTLMELLVVIAIMGLLVSIISASLVKARSAGKSFVCKNQLRNVAFDFIMFADEYAHPWRGDSDRLGGAFYIEDFQERQYGVKEFWKGSTMLMSTPVQIKPGEQPLICPAGPQELTRQGFKTMSQSPVLPLNNVSVGFNMRLWYGSVKGASPSAFSLTSTQVRLSKRIVNQGAVPLVFDVDGQAWAAKPAAPNKLPYYSAPPVGSVDAFASGAYWYPSLRHMGRLNAAFIGGHVLSSPTPEPVTK